MLMPGMIQLSDLFAREKKKKKKGRRNGGKALGPAVSIWADWQKRPACSAVSVLCSLLRGVLTRARGREGKRGCTPALRSHLSVVDLVSSH